MFTFFRLKSLRLMVGFILNLRMKATVPESVTDWESQVKSKHLRSCANVEQLVLGLPSKKIFWARKFVFYN